MVSSLFKELWEGYCPKLELVRMIGKKKDTDRPILIKFVHGHDKHKLLYETKNVPDGLKDKDNYKNDFANVFTNPCTVNKDTFHRIFLNRLKDMYVQDFRYPTSSKTQNFTKLYSDINRYEFQDYLEKKYFVKLRTGNNCLFLKKGRYESLPREERLCPLCNIEVEHLEHFVFKYSELKVKRKNFLSKLYNSTGESFRLEAFNPQLKKIFTLDFKKDNNTLTNTVSRGISDVYKARKS